MGAAWYSRAETSQPGDQPSVSSTAAWLGIGLGLGLGLGMGLGSLGLGIGLG